MGWVSGKWWNEQSKATRGYSQARGSRRQEEKRRGTAQRCGMRNLVANVARTCYDGVKRARGIL
jgi:hypothetical protein